MYSIGESVEYIDDEGKTKTGIINDVSSDLDSYVNLRVNDNDKVQYWSKKLKMYVNVKPKNIDTIYFTIPNRLRNEFVLIKDIIGSATNAEKSKENRNATIGR